MASYILRGSKQRGQKIGRVHVDPERALVLNGLPVELSNDEFQNLDQRYLLELDGAVDEQSTGDVPVVADPDDPNEDTTTSHTEKGGVK